LGNGLWRFELEFRRRPLSAPNNVSNSREHRGADEGSVRAGGWATQNGPRGERTLSPLIA
jgi:hypothetical protein